MAEFQFDEKLVRRLSKLLQETDLTEIEYESGGHRIRVARQIHRTMETMPAAVPAAAPAGNPGAHAPAKPEQSSEPIPEGAITSPMVGTVYTAPEPGAPPFVQVGDEVQEGQTLLIVEAMKVMNPLPSPRSGKVTKVLITNGQPVEFGEPLLVVE